MSQGNRFGFIGGGNMGEALIKGLVRSERAKPEKVMVYDVLSERVNQLIAEYGIRGADSNAMVVRESDIVVLAIKPQFMDQALGDIAAGVTPEHLVISIAAGTKLETLEQAMPPGVPVIRVMPNTPALVMAGISALSPGRHATPEHLESARAIFEAVGLTVTFDEKYLDAITGLSGSGPAYVFVLLEALADAGVRLGLPRKEAGLLAAQTVMGSAKLALESGLHPGQLKDMVTSPGGTTAAGLFVLERGALRGLINEAVAAAAAKAEELGKK